MTSNQTVEDSARWRWDWNDLCGAKGFEIWSVRTHDLGLCFEQLCLQIPALAMLATFSAFYCGQQVNYVLRGKPQILAINMRCVVVALLVVLPLLQIYIDLNKTDDHIDKISYFLSAVEGIAWLTHLGYALVLRKRLGLSPRGPTIMCVLWSLLAVMSVISLRTHLLIYKYDSRKNFSISLSFSFSIVKVILQLFYALTLIPSEGETVHLRYRQDDETQPLLGNNAYVRFLDERDLNYLGVAMEDVSWLSRLLFSWVAPLMNKGVEGLLNHPDDLYDLPVSLTCSTLAAKFNRALQGKEEPPKRYDPENSQASSSSTFIPTVAYKGTKERVSLLRALHRCFWVQFYGIGILKLIADVAGFAGPILLNKLVSFIEDKSEEIGYGYAYSAGLCGTTLLAAFCDVHFNFFMAAVGLKIRAAIVTSIYRKTLTVGGTVLNTAFSVGEIVNFMSTDTDRIVNSCPSFHAFWSIPFQVAVTLYLLYTQVGFAFLAGLVFSIILIPVNKAIASQIGKISTQMMEQKDERVKVMTEVLRGIRTIKIHVWEQHFVKYILRMREGELKYLKKRKYLDALCVYFWATTPVLISILTFGTYVLLGHALTAATVFTSMALINMLISPLNAFPWVLNGVMEAWVSIKRIQRLLDLPDLDLNSYYTSDILLDYPDHKLIISGADFNWGKPLSQEEFTQLHSPSVRKSVKNKGIGKRSSRTDDGILLEDPPGLLRDFHLDNISIKIKKGEFVGVIGTVGSGKSSLFAAILAEISKQQGIIAVADSEEGFGLVTQQPWLQRGTVRDNILFGNTFDQLKYKNVLHACCLNRDLLSLPAGDLTGVGEGGATLSGGQKARIALARAVYQDKAIYLLDDIISAVDSNVAKHIFQHCIMDLLKNKTRILCTHHVKYLLSADTVIVMDDGGIKQQGKPVDVLSNIEDLSHIDTDLEESYQSDRSFYLDSIDKETTSDVDSILNEEHRETGTVEFNVYSSYWKSVGHLLSMSILLALLLMQASRNMTDWWLAYWVSNEQASNSTNSSLHRVIPHRIVLSAPYMFLTMENTIANYLVVYISLAGLNSVFTLFRAFLFAYGGVVAAGKIHKLLLRSIMQSKITFFDISPLGRILNRFSSDTYTVDDSLPFILNILLALFFGLIGSVILTIYGLPWLCLVLVPLIPVYHWLQRYYRLTSRELKRISSVTLSPVYNHFNETLQGLSTIRALRAAKRFKRDNEENVEANMKAQFASQVASTWLSLRLQFIGVAMVTGVGFIAVIQHQFDVANPGLVGLAISYALSVTGLLSGVVNSFTETEREMIAVERISQYIEEVEPETSSYIMDPPCPWPCQGVVTFNNVVLKYREHLEPSLKEVTFETRPSEKVGVVGRTGAGKSSLIAALFRLVELHAGTITIDAVDVSRLSIHALRSRMSCIPQEPFLFSGTIRDNLDPLSEFRDQDLWSALQRVDLAKAVRRLGGLDSKFSSAGSNLSVGQRQLFCLARAVLHNAKILCIDEATANVDHETDRLIQATLRSAFRRSTVITIAHRIETIMDSDRVLVMGDGRVLEFDTPADLLADPSSNFYRLVNQE